MTRVILASCIFVIWPALVAILLAIAVPVSQLSFAIVEHRCCCPDPDECHCPDDKQHDDTGQSSIKQCHKTQQLVASLQPVPPGVSLVQVPQADVRVCVVSTALMHGPRAAPNLRRPDAPS